MRRYLLPSILLGGVLTIVAADVARALPYESFTLETGDRIIAETPGCYASCTVTGSKRTCTVKDFDCKVVCTTIQECKPDGLRPIKVCAVIRETR